MAGPFRGLDLPLEIRAMIFSELLVVKEMLDEHSDRDEEGGSHQTYVGYMTYSTGTAY